VYVAARIRRDSRTSDLREVSMSRSRLWLVIGLLALAATAFVAAGCGDDDDDDGGEETTAATGGGEDLGLITEGTLFIGVDTPYPPFEQGQPPNVTGYDIDVLNAIAEGLGLEVEYQDTGFATIFRDVAAGQFDTAAAASTIKPGREKEVDFTDPYYASATALVVAEGSDIATVDDLSGKIVGTQDGTIQEDFANNETDASEVRGFPEGTNALSSLLTGAVDAALIDEAVAADALEKQGGMEIADSFAATSPDLFGFAVAPENDALREAMNEQLATLKEDGTLAEFYEKYFDSEPPRQVLEGTNELLTDD
jgi:polar amino acid transport system substrate-binding protein